MWDRIERITAPAAEAITLAEAKLACRVDSSDQDDFLDGLIKAARELIEGPDGAGIVLLASQWRMRLDWMPPEIWIPTGPIMSIDSVQYVDDGGTLQTLDAASYQWRAGHFEARIRPAYNLSWPTVRRVFDAVRVTFTAGYAGTADSPIDLELIPSPLKTAMKMLISAWNETRESGVVPAPMEGAFSELVNRYRVGRFA